MHNGDARIFLGMGRPIVLTAGRSAFPFSHAGKYFGRYILRSINSVELNGSILELGTGSGALAIMLQGLGARNVHATDVDDAIIDIARQNEIRNAKAGESKIKFQRSDLFSQLSTNDVYNLILFNAPGWQTSATKSSEKTLKAMLGSNYYSRFEGDRLIFLSLCQIRERLSAAGRYLMTLNSLCGGEAIFSKYREWEAAHGLSPLRIRSVSQKEFFLDWKQDMWRDYRVPIMHEILYWQKENLCWFEENADGLKFVFEIIEVTHSERSAGLGT